MTKVKFKTAYGDRVRMPLSIEGESLTQQHMAQEADIRHIIRKHDRTGLITHVARGVATYGDYSEVNEYREALDIVRNASNSFMQLPAEIRKQFNNDPGEFFEFATDPANNEKMVELGLKEAPPSPEPQLVDVAKEMAKEKASRSQAGEQAATPKSDE